MPEILGLGKTLNLGLSVVPVDIADKSVVKDSNSFAIHNGSGCSIYHRDKPIYTFKQKTHFSIGDATYGPISLVRNEDGFTYEYSMDHYREDPFLSNYCKNHQVIVFYDKKYRNSYYSNSQEVTMFSQEAALLILDVTNLGLNKAELMKYALERLDPHTRPKAHKMVCLEKFNMDPFVSFEDISGNVIHCENYPIKHFPPKSIDDSCLQQFGRLMDLSDLQLVEFKELKILKKKYKVKKVYNLKKNSVSW